MILPLLEVKMRTITQPSLVGRHSSPLRGVTWPSEGDDVMYEAGWQHKVRLATLSLRVIVDKVFAQTRRQALGKQGKVNLNDIWKVTIL